MPGLKTFAVLLISIYAIATIEARSTTPTSIVDLPTKMFQRIQRYITSVTYWDTNNIVTRLSVLKQLAEEQDTVGSHLCPKIRHPIVCDNEGNLSENVCLFKAKRSGNADILPRLIFTAAPIEEARELCDMEIRKP